MAIALSGSLILSGSITVSGSIISTGPITMSGSIASASYASNAELLDGLDSSVFTLTSSFNAQTASLNAFSGSILTFTSSAATRLGALEAATSSLYNVTASLNTFSASVLTQTASFNAFSASILSYTASQNILNGTFATTGSNTFIGNQTITGSIFGSGSLTINGCITSTGQIVAQTINVQQVTSSIVYSCGSNIFGTTISNTQTMTGSVLITGSLNTIGNACMTSICSPSIVGGTVSGTTIYGSTAVCGGVICGGAATLTGALSGTSATFSSSVTAQQSKFWDGTQGLYIGAFTGGSGFGALYPSTVTPSNSNHALAASSGATVINTGASGIIDLEINTTSALYINNSRNVGIGTTSPTRLLDVNGVIRTQNSGSAGAPSIELGTSAQGNGLYYPTTNTIAITTNDTERMRITSTGIACFACQVCAPAFVGGTVSGTSATFSSNLQTNCVLTIGNQGVAGNYFLQITPSTTNRVSMQGLLAGVGISDIVMQPSSGNVGIGACSPQQILSVNNPFSSLNAVYPVIISQTGNAEIGGMYSTADSITNPIGAGLAFKTYQVNVGLTEKLRITHGGYVGIGCTSPSGKLQVANSSTQYALYTTTGNLELYTPEGNCGYVRLGSAYNLNGVYGSCGLNYIVTGTSAHAFRTTDNNTERLRIFSTGETCFSCQVCMPVLLASGCILINQTSAIQGVSTSVEMSGVGTVTPTSQASYNVHSWHGTNATWRGYLQFFKSRGTTIGSYTAVSNGDDLGTVRWSGADGSGAVIGAEINAYVDGVPGVNDMPTRLAFLTTADGASSPTERMRITSGGIACFASTVCAFGIMYGNDGGCFRSRSDARVLYLRQNTVTSDNIIQFIDHNGTYAWEVVGRNNTFYIYNATVANFSMCINPSTNAVHFPGAVSKGSGTFNIEHPLESKKCTHRLVHSFIEGPNADLFYSGHTTLMNGVSCINIDCAARMTEGTFLALNRCVRVFTTNETSWDAVRGKMVGNILVIESQNNESTDDISWMVIGERQDKHIIETSITDELGRIIVEPEIREDEKFTCICNQ